MMEPACFILFYFLVCKPKLGSLRTMTTTTTMNGTMMNDDGWLMMANMLTRVLYLLSVDLADTLTPRHVLERTTITRIKLGFVRGQAAQAFVLSECGGFRFLRVHGNKIARMFPSGKGLRSCEHEASGDPWGPWGGGTS